VGFFFRQYTGKIFTSDPGVISLAASLAPIMWGSYVVLCAGDIALGFLSGLGRNDAQGLAYVASTWGVGLPLAVLSARYTSWGLQGLWGGLLLGYFVLDISAFALVLTTNWERVAAEAKTRLEEEEEGEGGQEEE